MSSGGGQAKSVAREEEDRADLGSPRERGLLGPESLEPFLSPSLFSSASLRMQPKTRRTMLPTAISRGWALVRRCPTCCTRSMSWWTSFMWKASTTRRRRWTVAMAHGRELRIWRRLRRLEGKVSYGDGNGVDWCWLTYEIRRSMEVSTASVLTARRKVDRLGV